MKQSTLTLLAPVLLLALLPGCPNAPQPAGKTAAADSSLAAQSEIPETLPPAETLAVAASEPAAPKPEPKPEPRPEPPPRPKVLPRMWDYGSERCIPCQTMKDILEPMMAEYQGKVDIRIINVYEEKQLTAEARIQVIPTQIFYDPEGNELFRHIGVYPRDSIVAKFRQFGWE